MSAGTAIVWIENVPMSVEFDHTPAEPGSRWEPPVPAETEVTGIFIGGHEVSILLAPWVIDSVQAKTEAHIAEKRKEDADDMAEERGRAAAEFAAFGGMLRC